MHYSTMSLVHGYSHLDGNGHGKQPAPNNNETIDHWMQTKFNVTLASRDFRLPIAPEYARANPNGFEYIRDHLGYRLELRSAMLPLSLSVAGHGISFSFQAALINWGFAAPVSPRPVQLVLLAPNNSIVWSSESMADPRDWQPFVPGDPTFLPLLHRLHANVTIPSSALRCPVHRVSGKGAHTGGGATCAFKFGLFLPDMRMEKAIEEGPNTGAAWCIQLANKDVGWASGVNVLGNVTVSQLEIM
jgi:hypothetical protein